MTPPLIRAEAVSRSFRVGTGLLGGGAILRAVDEVSLEIRSGETLGIVGESGCGKSTLGKLLLRLLEPSSGRVLFGDTDLAQLSAGDLRRQRRWMQMIFQDPYSSLNPRMRVAEAISEPLEVHHPLLSRRERDERVAALMARVGLRPEQGARRPGEFSGGQRQRVVIARALASEPSFIVADEPVSALDVSVQAQILNLLRDLQAERHLTLAFISHDLKVIEHLSDEVAVMYLGRVVERAPVRELFQRPLHPYTEALLSAVPLVRREGRRTRILLKGELPSPLHPPPGCAFHPRCPLRERLAPPEQRRCQEVRPALQPRTSDPSRSSACHFADRLG